MIQKKYNESDIDDSGSSLGIAIASVSVFWAAVGIAIGRWLA